MLGFPVLRETFRSLRRLRCIEVVRICCEVDKFCYLKVDKVGYIVVDKVYYTEHDNISYIYEGR